MVDKSSIAWQLGDAFIKDPLKTKLYTSWFVYGDIELNYWSWMHFMSGFAMAMMFPQVSFLLWFIIHALWELYQISIGMTDVTNPRPEAIDILFDTIFAMLGYYSAKKLKAYYDYLP